VNIMNLFLTKLFAERQNVSSQRALELGLLTSFLPGSSGLVLGIVAARREAPTASFNTASGEEAGNRIPKAGATR
jgi:hypothetical protein